MRLMRLRDQVELTKEMTDSTVIYLSPHYRQLSAPGVAVNLKTEDATFKLRRLGGGRLTVHGSFITEMHLVA